MIKKVFLMLGIAAMLASCSQNEELFTDKGNNTVQQMTFTLATDEKPQTRAATDGLRYVVAVYDETGNPVRKTNENGICELFYDQERVLAFDYESICANYDIDLRTMKERVGRSFPENQSSNPIEYEPTE